jgi:flagellar assembly factor FliW
MEPAIREHRFGSFQGHPAMHINTTRFGKVEVLDTDIVEFPSGLIGMEDCRKWVLLADAENPALGWLQSIDRADLAVAVVSPRRFVAGYQARVSRRDLHGLQIDKAQDAQVLVVVGKDDHGLTLNLKAPLVIQLQSRRARQIVVQNDHSMRYPLSATVPMRRSA